MVGPTEGREINLRDQWRRKNRRYHESKTAKHARLDPECWIDLSIVLLFELA